MFRAWFVWHGRAGRHANMCAVVGVAHTTAKSGSASGTTVTDVLVEVDVAVLVSTGVDGVEAVEAFCRQHFDLVFMDVQMPRMDGNLATRHIRRLEEARGTPAEQRMPIIGLSANTLEEDAALAASAGMTAYHSKPYKLAELSKAIIQHALHNNRPTWQLERSTAEAEAMLAMFEAAMRDNSVGGEGNTDADAAAAKNATVTIRQ